MKGCVHLILIFVLVSGLLLAGCEKIEKSPINESEQDSVEQNVEETQGQLEE